MAKKGFRVPDVFKRNIKYKIAKLKIHGKIRQDVKSKSKIKSQKPKVRS